MLKLFSQLQMRKVLLITFSVLMAMGSSTLGFSHASGNTQKVVLHHQVQVAQTSGTAWERTVSKANPYVHIKNGIASIDPQITTVLMGSELNMVNQFVAKFNQLPTLLRQHPYYVGIVTVNKNANGNLTPQSTAFQWYYNVYW